MSYCAGAVLSLWLIGHIGCERHHQPALTRAAGYLWARQAEDGGWHSHTYGLLRSGQSLTPFVLEALLQIPETVGPLPKTRVDRAIAFIQTHTQSGGALGVADPGIPDYPNYATALAVSALCRARRADWQGPGAPQPPDPRHHSTTGQ